MTTLTSLTNIEMAESRTPSIRDGFNGAADASLLERYAQLLGMQNGKVTVQATRHTRALLHRAGLRRVRLMDSYEVRVERDRFNRLQLAA